ncbi:hypothetical protein A2U01_0036563, partial [Trifolium medium]|nr:hypothetical protein [Trifolium medium]
NLLGKVVKWRKLNFFYSESEETNFFTVTGDASARYTVVGDAVAAVDNMEKTHREGRWR